MKIEQNIFIPHEDVAKYLGTPPCFTPPWYPALKMTGPLISKLTLKSIVVSGMMVSGGINQVIVIVQIELPELIPKS